MIEKSCCFSGHRVIPQARLAALRRCLEKCVEARIQAGYLDFYAGGALGFDTLAALTVLKLKKRYPQIRLLLALPCLSQANAWSERDREQYQRILQQADQVIYTAQQYVPGCMQKRNRYLVDHSSACIYYLTAPNGGTAYTVSYARSRGLELIDLAASLQY